MIVFKNVKDYENQFLKNDVKVIISENIVFEYFGMYMYLLFKKCI